MKVKEEVEKVGLKVNIQETKIMASGPITSWQIDRETVETMTDFLFSCSTKSLQMVTAVMQFKNACSCFLCHRKVMTNLDSILKSRYILLTKVHLFKGIVFPVVTC